ncbi:hypothetical protein [Amycolatopsis sp. NBC_01286]|uniref:hypothetical protein n=1 Tax=Amycolatopsis sp. NBC_01286 TaxID=2903560 RepID=UPI002E0E2A0B|nr:hypothetical protein OG570_08365 [Amycolatopsis sp. NBC_01286]
MTLLLIPRFPLFKLLLMMLFISRLLGLPLVLRWMLSGLPSIPSSPLRLGRLR